MNLLLLFDFLIESLILLLHDQLSSFNIVLVVFLLSNLLQFLPRRFKFHLVEQVLTDECFLLDLELAFVHYLQVSFLRAKVRFIIALLGPLQFVPFIVILIYLMQNILLMFSIFVPDVITIELHEYVVLRL